jgi:hypothetical protein
MTKPTFQLKTFHLLILIFTFILAENVHAQDGRYVSSWGAFQFTGLNNTDDQLNRNYRTRSTYGYAAGFSYFNNEGTTGFRTGLSYSDQGQRYAGSFIYAEATDTTDQIIKDFNSEIRFRYLKIPLLFNFNSLFNEAETVNLTVYAGFQAGILLSASMTSDPAPTEFDVEVREFFKTVDVSFVAGSVFNFKLSDEWLTYFGVKMDRTLGTAERLDYEYNTSYPAEYFFPVSVKKSSRPSPRDMPNRRSSKNVAIAIKLGIAYKIN